MRSMRALAAGATDWLSRHPLAQLAAFVALMALGMALCGLDDHADRMRDLQGV